MVFLFKVLDPVIPERDMVSGQVGEQHSFAAFVEMIIIIDDI